MIIIPASEGERKRMLIEGYAPDAEGDIDYDMMKARDANMYIGGNSIYQEEFSEAMDWVMNSSTGELLENKE